MQTQDAKYLLSELKRGSIFLPVGDYIEVREDGAGPNVLLKFNGPCNNTVERAEACPIVYSRDYGALAVLFTALAKREGTLGDMELTIREVLLSPDPEEVRKKREEQKKLAEEGIVPPLLLDDAELVDKDFEV